MIAVVDARIGHAAELRVAVVELAGAVQQEPGCLAFIPYEEVGRPGRFYLYEIYANGDAFTAHLETPHVGRFLAALTSFSTSGAKDLVQLTELPMP